MAKITVKPQYKKVVRMFESLSGSKSLWQIYQDFIEISALSIQNNVEIFPKRFEIHEKIYKNIYGNYSDNEMQVFSEIFTELVIMLENNPFQDLLGDLYMQLDMGSAAIGQFFTPYCVSRAMDECVFDEAFYKKTIAENGVIRVSEPCIGGGANVIGLLDVLHSNGINYHKNVLIIGQDLSRVTALMAYIVLSLMGCQAVIKIDDSLIHPYTNFFDEIKKEGAVFYTPMLALNGFKVLR